MHFKTIILALFVAAVAAGQEIRPLSPEEISYSCQHHLKYETDSVQRFVVYRGYVAQYNYDMKSPNFTEYELTPEQISSLIGERAPRRSAFFVDPRLDSQSATNADYSRSGYDKGHMTPAGDFYWNRLLKDETFALTNITPQNPVLNRGIWASLENAIRQLVISHGSPAYVVSGAVYSTTLGKTIGCNKVGVPICLYKVVYLPSKPVMYAFAFDNTVETYLGGLPSFQVTVKDIERLTREDFFDALDDHLEDSLESIIIPLEQ